MHKVKPRRFSQKIRSKELVVLSRQLATLVQSGIPITQACQFIGYRHENAAMKYLLQRVQGSVESGNTLAESLKQFPRHFDPLFCHLVAVGEQSGTLDTLLHRIAWHQEKKQQLKAKIQKALFYPAAVVIVAVLVILILLVYVVPQFEQLFQSFHAELPAFTQMVIAGSRAIQEYGSKGLLAGLLIGCWFAKIGRHHPLIAYWINTLSLHVPWIGSILRQSILSRFARTLSITFAAGLPLVDALWLVSEASGHPIYATAIRNMRKEVLTGQALHIAMRQTRLFPHLMIQMIAVGEASGTVDTLLAKMADFYESEMDLAVNTLSSLLEPAIMVILGILVGGLVMAMYWPIFTMGSVI